MNLTSRPIGVMQKKQVFIGILLLSLALVPRTAMAELNDGSLSSTDQSTPVHEEANTDSDQRFLAAPCFESAEDRRRTGFRRVTICKRDDLMAVPSVRLCRSIYPLLLLDFTEGPDRRGVDRCSIDIEHRAVA
jgi:hypothetical protein